MNDRIPADFDLRVAMGQSDPEIADYAGVDPRTVRRWRARLGLPSRWAPEPPEHGTRSRYNTGCDCPPCRTANAAYSAHTRRVHAYAAHRRQEVATA